VRARALLLDRDLSLRLGERELPAPGPAELLVRVEWAGVCGSDLHVLRTGDWVTSWPATLGHEVTGVVEASPGGEPPAGTRVVIDSRVPCGTCPGCAAGPQLCEHLGWFGEACPGGFASHVLVPAGRVAACPDDLEPAVAVLAEPLAVAMHAVSRVSEPPGRAVILGYGPIGALVHLELTRRWPQTAVSVVEPVAVRRQLAEAFGAETAAAAGGPTVTAPAPAAPTGTTDAPRTATSSGPATPTSSGPATPATSGPATPATAAATPAAAAATPATAPTAGRARLVVDAAGCPGSLADAIDRCASGGTVLVVALGHEPVPVLPAALAERELTLAGCNGFAGELPAAVDALAAEPGRYRPLVTEAILLDEAPRRLGELLTDPAAGKAVIRPSCD
jgi:threonine dehydrogenase-like Zn-dependent dehydrogenase